jgi:hypothetical protein
MTMDDDFTGSNLTAGIACRELIASPESWINRRVETIEMLTHEETRRRVSIDFTLSDGQMADLTTDEGLVVPLSVLTKEPRRNFDLRDESGAAVPVLGKQQNGELALIALMSAAVEALPTGVTPEVFELLAAELRRVVFDAPDAAADALGYFIASAEAGDRWHGAIWQDEKCRSLLDALWLNYVLFAVIAPDTSNRRVLKYSYGEDFPLDPDDQPLGERVHPAQLLAHVWRPDRRRFVIDCPAAWRAASFHVEIAIPEELRIERAFLYDLETEEPLSGRDVNVNRAALYATEPLNDQRSTVAYAEVAPERAGRSSLAAMTGLAVAALLWFGVLSGLDARNPSAAISILLAGAAVLSGLAAAQGEHRLIRRVFAASRRWLGLVAVTALAASASLAMELPDREPVETWRVCAIVCSLAAARLVWSAIRAPS